MNTAKKNSKGKKVTENMQGLFMKLSNSHYQTLKNSTQFNCSIFFS